MKLSPPALVTPFEMIFEPTSLPDRMGVMLLPNAVLLPGAMMPLFIFEPRYREMLANALDGQRVFALAAPSNDAEVDDPRSLIGGAGIVRACVKNDDGTSHLVLQGVSRVRLSNWDPSSNYPLAHAEPVLPVESDPAACRSLRREIHTMLTGLISSQTPAQKELLASLSACPCASSFSDLAAACIVGDPSIRQLLLEETDTHRRLEILAALLTEAAASRQESS